MSLAITAGSLSTLRPLYRVVAKRFSWKTSVFSTHKSYGVLPHSAKRNNAAGSVKTEGSQSESNRKFVRVEDGDFALQECRPVPAEMRPEMGITKVTNVQIDFEDQKRP
jgi:hypothetical protein